ncbi:hypothetical protein BDY21DRAFT_340238 [Lineolata rhizophorae]|uniref:Uncharacterized protein n=1 Tax=Lineolata rhizophorae TaxID=578093 RepID=A0A6A6P5H4_9PEZI|nr:hypothetical protein BDY21DRAFT_340238 [Lineolata rhizophorae]
MESPSVLKREVSKPTDPDGLVLEGWAQGFMVGSLIIMSSITLANMRKGVLLHKLILLELLLGIWHGFWILLHNPMYAWWLSVSAIFLNASWSLHNVIAWMKIKPFLRRPISLLFIWSVILVQPYWVLEIYANFAYFHNVNTIFLRTRPWEALCRDPWWIATTVLLFYNIKTRYELSLSEIIRLSPRFGVMLGAMIISIIFIVLDVCSVTNTFDASGLPVGINPFWKISFVFKCLTDSAILDDFKTALDRLRAYKVSRLGSFAIDSSDQRMRDDGELEAQWSSVANPRHEDRLPSPDSVYFPHKWRETNTRKSHFEKIPQGKKRYLANGNSRDRDEVGPSSVDPKHRRQPSPPRTFDPNDSTLELHDVGNLAGGDYARAMREVSLDSDNPPGHKRA